MGQIKNIKLHIVTDIKEPTPTMAFASRIINFNILKKSLATVVRRNIGASSVVLSKLEEATDPVQKLFLTKLNEYNEKLAGLEEGELYDVSAEIVEEKNFMLGNIEKRYGTEAEMTEPPKFSWEA